MALERERKENKKLRKKNKGETSLKKIEKGASLLYRGRPGLGGKGGGRILENGGSPNDRRKKNELTLRGGPRLKKGKKAHRKSGWKKHGPPARLKGIGERPLCKGKKEKDLEEVTFLEKRGQAFWGGRMAA